MIEEGLMTYLLAQSGITAYVSDRISPAMADQDVETPYIIVTKVSGAREHSHDGSSHLAHPRFQLSIFAETYKECKDIAAAVQSALQGYAGAMGSETVQNVIYRNEVDDYEDETGLYGVKVDYDIWHVE